MEAPGSAGSREPGCCRPRAAAGVLPPALVFLHDTVLIYSRRPRHAGDSAKRGPSSNAAPRMCFINKGSRPLLAPVTDYIAAC